MLETLFVSYHCSTGPAVSDYSVTVVAAAKLVNSNDARSPAQALNRCFVRAVIERRGLLR